MKPEIQPNNKISQIIPAIVISVLLTAIIFALGAYVLFKNSLNQKQQLEQKIANLQTQIDQSQSEEVKNDTSSLLGAHSVENILTQVDKKLLQINPNILLKPNAGYMITTSIISNKKDMIVYAEISDCLGLVNVYYNNKPGCDYKYNIFVKNLQTKEVKMIYSYPEKVTLLKNLQKLVISEAKAGGCSVVPFPIAWSKNDQKVVLQWGNPTDCGAGGGPNYLTYTINPAGGKLEPLARYNEVFLDNYDKVVFIDESEKSPSDCGPGPQANNGKIVLKYIEEEKIITLLEEPNSDYSALEIDQNQTTLNYSVEEVFATANGCRDYNRPVTKKIGQIQIP